MADFRINAYRYSSKTSKAIVSSLAQCNIRAEGFSECGYLALRFPPSRFDFVFVPKGAIARLKALEPGADAAVTVAALMGEGIKPIYSEARACHDQRVKDKLKSWLKGDYVEALKVE